MSFFNYLSENFVLQISDLLLNRSISANFKLLQSSQWWTEEELRIHQEEKLERLIYHAYHNVPYYNDLFKRLGLRPVDIRSREDLTKLPLLTKEEIRKNYPGKIVSKNINKKDFYTTGSSGSTGEPLKYLISKEAYSLNTAAKLRGWYWMGYRLGDKFVKLSQNPRKRFEKRVQDLINRDRYLFVQQLTTENFEELLSELRKFKPEVIRGYPDPLMFLAQHMEKTGINDINPIAVNTTGNILYPEARDLIERQFKCRIFDSYNAEAGAVAYECVTHSCYHLAMEYAITEILDNGKEAKPGRKGRLITTDLTNYAMPFIRYDTQDVVTKGEGKCKCGRALETITRIEGRDNDILITPSGKYLIVHNFTGYFQRPDTPAYGKVDQFQIVQEKKDLIIINIVEGNGFNEDIRLKILTYFENYIGNDVHVEVKIVEQIPVSVSGKRRFLVRNPEISLVSI
jgi:phenylacetate-CoA ligase